MTQRVNIKHALFLMSIIQYQREKERMIDFLKRESQTGEKGERDRQMREDRAERGRGV